MVLVWDGMLWIIALVKHWVVFIGFQRLGAENKSKQLIIFIFLRGVYG